MNTKKLENFERAFRSGIHGCRNRCACGREFYDNYNEGYSWDDGELEALKTDPSAVALDYAPGVIEFEGGQYVDGCSCWHARAQFVMRFIDSHALPIATYLTLEKQRKQTCADESPVVG